MQWSGANHSVRLSVESIQIRNFRVLHRNVSLKCWPMRNDFRMYSVSPKYPPGNTVDITPHSRTVYFGDANKGAIRIDDHYWLGGISPCETDCSGGPTGVREASWDAGVAVNTTFLNNYNHDGHPWNLLPVTQYVSFRNDFNAFHIQ